MSEIQILSSSRIGGESESESELADGFEHFFLLTVASGPQFESLLLI